MAETNTPEKSSSAVKSIFEWIEIFVYSFAVVLIVITFIARHSPVKGESMMDTLHENDFLIVSDLFYTPKQGDIIVFQSPVAGYDEPYVKRIIATEGQTIDINFETWEVTVDGNVLDEYYVLKEDKEMRGSTLEYPFVVPEGMVFVMGDNRNHSQDSRYGRLGPIDTRFILGRVVLRVFPFSRFGPVD